MAPDDEEAVAVLVLSAAADEVSAGEEEEPAEVGRLAWVLMNLRNKPRGRGCCCCCCCCWLACSSGANELNFELMVESHEDGARDKEALDFRMLFLGFPSGLYA